MKLKSFGCSFIYGSDLSDCVPPAQPYDIDEPSQSTWPALIADQLGLVYECFAKPGCGNLRILSSIISEANLNDPAVFVINWTWIDRFDYVNQYEEWQTLLPNQSSTESMFYYKHFYSQIKDMLTSVYNVSTAIDFLRYRDIPFLMCYMDHNLLTPIDLNWHDPRYLEIMQEKIRHHLSDFDGKNFLDWSADQSFEISESWHPLERAHAAAANYMMPAIDAILRRA